MFGFGAGVIKSLLFDKKKEEGVPYLSTGVVMDTNDPDQMGRIRVRCSRFGDRTEKEVEDLPWALPISPLAGVMTHGVRGVEQETVNSPVAYGMWNIPKTGSFVLVGCIDGDKSKRFYLGGLHPNHVTNTLPHGRYAWGYTEAEESKAPDGPMSASEIPIQPLYDNQTQQFTAPDASLTRRASGTPDKPRTQNAEYVTRGADMQASATNNATIQSKDNNPGSSVPDHDPGTPIKFKKVDGDTKEIAGPGYSIDQIDPEEKYGPDTGYVNYDSQNYSWTTPGFHAFSMNDRYDNCRIRLRTTSGHQIILDDTNERIYVSTAGGQAYVEIDKVGNIDIFSEKTISTHAKGDINFYSDQSIRLQAVKDVHIRADREIRQHALQDVHIETSQNIRVKSGQETRIEVGTTMHTNVGSTLFITSGDNLDMSTGAQMNLLSADQMSLKSGARIAGDAPDIHWNSAHAYDAVAAENSNVRQAWWTNRVPDHEPWARVFMKPDKSDQDANNSHEATYPYTDALVGKKGIMDGVEEDYHRNVWWQR
jgi:hypothetical protein